MKQRGWLIAGFVGVFGLGAVAGGAAFAGYRARHQAALFGQEGRGSYSVVLNRRLKLSPEQRGTVDGVISRFETDREHIMAPVEPAVRERRAAMRREVRATLDTEQIPDFDAINREFDENRARRLGHAAPASSETAAELGTSNR